MVNSFIIGIVFILAIYAVHRNNKKVSKDVKLRSYGIDPDNFYILKKTFENMPPYLNKDMTLIDEVYKEAFFDWATTLLHMLHGNKYHRTLNKHVSDNERYYESSEACEQSIIMMLRSDIMKEKKLYDKMVELFDNMNNPSAKKEEKDVEEEEDNIVKLKDISSKNIVHKGIVEKLYSLQLIVKKINEELATNPDKINMLSSFIVTYHNQTLSFVDHAIYLENTIFTNKFKQDSLKEIEKTLDSFVKPYMQAYKKVLDGNLLKIKVELETIKRIMEMEKTIGEEDDETSIFEKDRG